MQDMRETPRPTAVAAVEFYLPQAMSEFDEEKFRRAFQDATGILASEVRISSLRREGIVVTVEGDSDILREIVLKGPSAGDHGEALEGLAPRDRLRFLDAAGRLLSEVAAPLGLLYAYYVVRFEGTRRSRWIPIKRLP